MSEIDLEEDTPTAEQLPDELEDLIHETVLMDREMKEHEELAANLKRKLTERLTRIIPEKLAAVGVSGVTTSEGVRVVVGVDASGSWNKAPDQAEAVRYMEEMGFEGSVLTKLEVDFTEAQRDLAGEIAHDLQDLDKLKGKSVTLDRKIHYQTIRAFVRQAAREHADFDPTKVGFTTFTTANITSKGNI